MEDLKGVTILITGSTSGLGLHTAKKLFLRGATVIITCRDEVRGRRTLEEVISVCKDNDETKDQFRAHLYSLDLTSYRSIVNFTEELKRDFDAIDVIVNNAGIMGTEFELSSDGVEMNFATNVFGHYVLVNRLLPLLANSHWNGGSRVVVVSSGLYKYVHSTPTAKQLMGEKHWDYVSREAYAYSKLANCQYAVALDTLLKRKGINVKVYCVRPGFVRGTNLGRETHWILRWLAVPAIWWFSKSLDQGISTIVQLSATASTTLESGRIYYEQASEEYTSNVNDTSVRKLWAVLHYMEEMIWKRDATLTPDEVEAAKKARDLLPDDLWAQDGVIGSVAEQGDPSDVTTELD